MKKICVLLVLALALACVPAMAAEGDALLGRSEDNNLYFNYGFAVGDTLYGVGYNSLYTYRLGEPDVTEYIYNMPDDDGTYDYGIMPFADGDKLYALELITHYDETTEFEGAKIASMTLNDDHTATFEALFDVDWEDMVEYYDNNAYAQRPEGVIGAAGKVIMRNYKVDGSGYVVFSIDLGNGRREDIDDLQYANCMTPYKDGTLLAEIYDYDRNSETISLVAYDPADDSINPIGEVKVGYNAPYGLAYDPDTDTIYCVRGGEICPIDVEAGEILEGVTDMPVEYANFASACVLKGGYYAIFCDGMGIRNLDPGQKAEARLKINDNGWCEAVNDAYYRFSNAHGNISVVLSREYSETENLIESMMNRDDSVDIYTLSTSTSIYDALYNRGYLMELDGSAKLSALAEGMYPGIREALSSNGHLVALPLSTYAYTLGINDKALAALGKSMDDVPDNWPEFLDFLISLESVIGEDGKVKLFYPGYTDVDARNDLFITIFEDYQRYVNMTDPTMGYNTDMLRSLIEKLEQVNFQALGCISEEDREDYEDTEYEYTEDGMLLQLGTGCTIGNFYSGFTPVLLGMAPGLSNPIALETTVAIVNPFTQHPDVALAFMEELADNIPAGTRYCIDPTLSEPVRGKWNDEAIEELNRQLDELKRDLETADAADKQMIEDSIHDTEESLKYYDEFGWDVGPKDIEWYRAHDEDITVARVNWLYSDDTGEAGLLIDQYRDGLISAADMLAGIDKKVQMMLLEGN